MSMISLTFAAVLLIISMLAVVVRKTYFAIPLVELRRRARGGDELANVLYRSVAYDGSLRLLLWIIITFSSSASFVIFARQSPAWLSLLVVTTALWLAFSWIPKSRVTLLGNKITYKVTPSIAWLLNYLHPVLSRGSDFVTRRYAKPHTGIYQRSDLIELIERQELQSDNRLAVSELAIATRALHFPDRKLADIMIPRKSIRIISGNDTIGPILIDEIHKSGQSVALVRDTPKGPITGWLQFKDLNINTSGLVSDMMSSKVYYLHESDSLSEALHAFIVTNQSLFIVVNNAEENVGVITVQKILEQLLGHIPGDDFDEYASASSVSQRHNQPKVQKPDDDIDEVVEV